MVILRRLAKLHPAGGELGRQSRRHRCYDSGDEIQHMHVIAALRGQRDGPRRARSFRVDVVESK